MNGNVPEVDVVILTWNDGELLDRAVRSVLDSDGVEVAVVVVDNGSTEPVAFPHDPQVRVLRNEQNRGVAPGRNQGVRVGTAPVVCILDSDARLRPAALREMLDVLEEEARAGLVAPVFVGQRPEESAGIAPTFRRKVLRGLNLRADYDGVERDPDARWWPVDFAIGACQVFRRSAFEAVGGLDETYFYGPEDVDFCLRLRVAGWRILQVRTAECEHPPRRRFRGLASAKGRAHAMAVARHLWRHRRFRRLAGAP
jgi:N-acetylglucosaminyl-diphospho-decaprenol L-rhamnosyltransferase